MLANLTTPFLGVVATAAIGRLGESHLLGGVAMASVVFDCMFWLFGFLRMGTVALTAQAQGASDAPEIRAVLVRAVLLSSVVGLALLALQLPLSSAVFGLLGGSDAVTAAAKTYFAIRLWSAPFVLANYVLLGWLVGQARPGSALMLQIIINVVNMAATVWLVLGAGKGIAGAAIAAIIAEGAGCIAGAIVAWRLLGGRFGVTSRTLFDRAKLGRMLAVNRDIMIRTAALIAVFLFFTAEGARAGDNVLAANAVLNNFMLIGSFFLDGLANAAEQLCGRSIGARDRTGFSQAVRLIVIWGFAFAAAVTIVFVTAGGPLIDFITTSPDVRQTARDYMWLAALAPLCGVMAYAFDGVYIGATWSRDMRNLMIVSLGCYFAGWWLLKPLGNAGLWGALLVFLLARGLLQMMRYRGLLRATFA
ncbi:MATE family efflux transporter [Bradyrhizobium sp. U87765 SZCCT0131]|nr:MATE family efflux transporter [Bradyrhizobium sp. U87765 SZCCT0131]MBR1260148.1 MATE family efflux transporter [Bradyrhizobium sp. U87765 SZCCT0134]MBR1307603.1 MATE family efflux transporter [Bradyrhizobium sp. U87765 SZCCT0110]MBR1321557.1 MATE family efflux transporter [Bradyrhizobium sp. U87765 SZCCT0109]MBR1349870.1 MATE family efflux transporter [Bradyrhizobium sp. U87765 SZCCT0048]